MCENLPRDLGLDQVTARNKHSLQQRRIPKESERERESIETYVLLLCKTTVE